MAENYFKRILEKLRSSLARLSSGRRFTLPLFFVYLKGLRERLAFSSPYRRMRGTSKTSVPSPGRPSGLLARATATDTMAGTKERNAEFRRPPENKRMPLPRPYLGKRIDIFLVAAMSVILIFVIPGFYSRLGGKVATIIDISVSPQFWTMFGETADLLLEEFHQQHPDFRIIVADDENTDIIFFDDGTFASLVDSSALASLGPYIYTPSGEEAPKARVLLSFIDLFFYNIDILQNAGNDRPPTTRAEFLAMAESVARTYADNEVSPFAIALAEETPTRIRNDFYPWVWALGGDVRFGFSGEGAFEPSPQTTNAVNFLARMNLDHLLAEGTFRRTGEELLVMFAEGKVAMILASSRDIPFLRNAGRINFDVTAVPALASGRNRLGVSGIYAGISSTSPHPEHAWAFIVFVESKINLLAEILGAVPGNLFANFPPRYIEDDGMYAKVWDIFEDAEIVEFASDDVQEIEAAKQIRLMLERAFEPILEN